MGSIERKLSRKIAIKEKKNAEKDMATKIALFDKLPDKCLTCDKTFDKMDKEQVMSWSVIVKQQEEKVNLYCPNCWEKAVKIIEDFKKHLEEKRKASE
tara:strand:- start:878 stop:1171 length:294 start_codon:yes stop_codon:yes gene_type:complete